MYVVEIKNPVEYARKRLREFVDYRDEDIEIEAHARGFKYTTSENIDKLLLSAVSVDTKAVVAYYHHLCNIWGDHIMHIPVTECPGRWYKVVVHVKPYYAPAERMLCVGGHTGNSAALVCSRLKKIRREARLGAADRFGSPLDRVMLALRGRKPRNPFCGSLYTSCYQL